MTTVLMITLLMLFVGFLDSPVTPTGQADKYGIFKMITKLKWAMLIAVADTGVFVLTKRGLIVGTIKMFFFYAVKLYQVNESLPG